MSSYWVPSWFGGLLQSVAGGQSIHPNVEDAQRLLSCALEAGRQVDQDTISAIADMRAAAKRDPTGAGGAAQLTFYKAYAKLKAETADLSRGGAPAEQPFEDAVDDAEQLLKYAAESGTGIPQPVSAEIFAARTAINGNGLTDSIRSSFYTAYSTLSKSFGDVTAETIRNCTSPKARHTLWLNRVFAFSITILVAGLSVVTFVADSMSKKILDDVAQANSLAAELRLGLTATANSPEILQKYSADACSMIVDRPGEGEKTISSLQDVQMLQELAATNRELLGKALKLNNLLGDVLFLHNLESDPVNGAGNPPEVARRQMELNPSIVNYTAEALCKIGVLQNVRNFALNVQADYAAIIGAVTSYALPICYAVLGAFAYRLRLFAETIRKRTYHPSFADSARMITAVIAGAIAGLFNPAQGLSLQPLAAAFLVGYGVELFFRFLDTLIAGFGTGAPAAPK